MTMRLFLLAALAGTMCGSAAATEPPAHGWLQDGPIYETHPCYHGGSFRGITDRLPQIAALGVKTIYLMPVWEQPYDYGDQPERRYRNI